MWPKSRDALFALKTSAPHAFRQQIVSVDTWYVRTVESLTNVTFAIGKLAENVQKFQNAMNVIGKLVARGVLPTPASRVSAGFVTSATKIEET